MIKTLLYRLNIRRDLPPHCIAGTVPENVFSVFNLILLNEKHVDNKVQLKNAACPKIAGPIIKKTLFNIYSHFFTKGLLIVVLLAILSPGSLLAITVASNPAKFANAYLDSASSNASNPNGG